MNLREALRAYEEANKRTTPAAAFQLACAAREELARQAQRAKGEQFVEQVARSARLYQRGLITAQEFTNVTLNDLRALQAPPSMDLGD